MTRRALQRHLVPAALVAGVALVALDALARPGGGQTYSGGSHGGGGGPSGGGGGGGFVLWLLFNLLPWPLKLLLIVGVVLYAVFRQGPRRQMQDWSTMGSSSSSFVPAARAPAESRSMRRVLGGLRQYDPGFSLVLFDDFLYALYAEAHQRRAKGELEMLSAYLAPPVIAKMSAEPREPVLGVVIGALRLVEASFSDVGPDARVRAVVELEVNLTVQTAHGPASAYLVERWALERRAGAKSPPADKTRVFPCPNCGAPQTAVMAGRCTHCNQAVSTGNFGWVVTRADVVQKELRPPLLTTDVAEEGTDLPTVFDPDARAALDALWRRDPSFLWPAFEQRIALVFTTFQGAWSNRDLSGMRPFLSDNLMQTEEYWVLAYTAQKLRNVTENARIERIELARVQSDASFDALTVRLYAASLDYTLSDDGKVVTGSKHRERRYSEYWTFIRGSNRKGPTKTEPVCPNCGAPLAVNMAGTCTYCKAKVTTGEFDWVLSRIEQDESYTG